VKLEPLYRLTFHYPESWLVEVDDERGAESEHFLIAEGRQPLPERPRYD
jgi:hypothetical protein